MVSSSGWCWVQWYVLISSPGDCAHAHAESHCPRPFQLNPIDKVVMSTYKWEGPKCLPTHNSRCRQEFGELEARGVCGESHMWKVRFRASWKSFTAALSKVPDGKLCMLYPELLHQQFLPCLIPNWIHSPKCRDLLCFFSRSSKQQLWEQWGAWQLFYVFQDSNWALKSLICQLIFIGSQFKIKWKFSYSIGTTSNFKMTFLMYFLLNTM